MAPLSSAPAPNLTNDPYLALLSPPAIGLPVAYRIRFALQAAVLAPSVHNTQPWRFRIQDGTDSWVDLLVDPERALPALDPDHRQLVISCGAALSALEVGLLGCGLQPQIELLPAGEPACLARIHVSDRGAVDEAARASWPLLTRRRSYRGAVSHRLITPYLENQLVQAAAPSAALHFVPEHQWRDLERLITDASLAESETPAVSEEVRSWTRVDERTQDGIPPANWQRTSKQTALGPVVQRDFAQGRSVPGERPVTGVEGNPRLAVLLTAADTASDWIGAGQALMRVALSAESAGLGLGYLNQPTEVAGLRSRLALLLTPCSVGFEVPQLVVRLGYPAQALPPASPRRPVRDVLIDLPDTATT